MRDTSVVVCADKAAIAERALDLLIDGLRTGVARRGAAHLALTGGSSASALFRLLRSASRAERVDWSRVHVWQGDERFVPLDHADRNWAGALREWLEVDGGRDAIRHPIPVDVALDGGHDAAWAADRYAHELSEALPMRRGVPAFDVLLLGMGGDGHIMSAFPDTSPVTEERVAVLPVAAPTHIEPHLPRVTLAPFVLRGAGTIVVMVPGAGKAATVREVLTSPPQPQRLPAQLAVRPNAVWLLEPGSAREL
ncbi:MAG: 6-phosphogluconolactonase [Chloroflexota bacterium]|jgi:6-phosphogluconolactonase